MSVGGSVVGDVQGDCACVPWWWGRAWVRWLLDLPGERKLRFGIIVYMLGALFSAGDFVSRSRMPGLRCKLPWLNLNPCRVASLRIDCRVFPANSEVVHAHIPFIIYRV